MAFCNSPELHANEIFSIKNFSVGATTLIGCQSGYRVQGYQNLTCHPDGYWIGDRPFCHFLDCGKPPAIKEGTSRSGGPQNGLGSIVTYTCDTNTTLLGDPVIYCTEQEIWSGYPPTCIGRWRERNEDESKTYRKKSTWSQHTLLLKQSIQHQINSFHQLHLT